MTTRGREVLEEMTAGGWRIVAAPGKRPRFYHPHRDEFGGYVHGQTLNSLAGDGLVEIEEHAFAVTRVYALSEDGIAAASGARRDMK